MLGECCQLDPREVSYKNIIWCNLSNLMMVMTMTMMLNADKMTISGRVWSLRGQGGGEGGSRLTFRLMAVVIVAMVAGVTMIVITKMLLVTFMSRCHFDQARICKCCTNVSEILEQLNQHWILVLFDIGFGAPPLPWSYSPFIQNQEHHHWGPKTDHAAVFNPDGGINVFHHNQKGTDMKSNDINRRDC